MPNRSDGAGRACTSTGWSARGRKTLKTVPSPTVDCRPISPPSLRTIESTVASPRPVPCFFVVKKGSQIFSRCSGLIPLPLSRTSNST